jgi:hypothetical protein
VEKNGLIGFSPSEVANIIDHASFDRRGVFRNVGEDVTYFDNLVPTARDDNGIHHVRAKSHT